MKRNHFWSLAAYIGVLVVAMNVGAMAQGPTQLSFNGLINDYTAPSSGWEVRGEWSLSVKGDSGKADFSAEVNMVHSDIWLVLNGLTATRNQHTHHINLSDGVVTTLSNGFRVTGTATVTSNGSPAAFGGASPVQIDITGGSSVAFSNIQITFGSPGSGHFGSQALNGVVTNPK